MHLLQTLHLRLQYRLREQQLVLSFPLFQVQNVRSGAEREAVCENKAFDLLHRLLSKTGGESEEEGGEENGKRKASLWWDCVATNIGIAQQIRVLIYSQTKAELYIISPPKLCFCYLFETLHSVYICTTIQAMNDTINYIPTGHQKNHFKMVSRGNIYEQVHMTECKQAITLPPSKSVSQKHSRPPRPH